MTENRRRRLARTCTVDGCSLTHQARGYCSVHYSRWQRFRTTELTATGAECAMRLCVRRVPLDPAGGICRECRIHLEAGSCRIIGCHQSSNASLDGRPYCDDHFRWWPELMEPEMDDGTMLAPVGLGD